MMDPNHRPDGLLPWQWALYPGGHTTRVNLLIHILTVPMFDVGTLALLSSFVTGRNFAAAGVLMTAGAMVMQGRGHATEPQPPVRFLGPLDVLARIMAEQWIAFPRFVLTGGFARAWRSASARPKP